MDDLTGSRPVPSAGPSRLQLRQILTARSPLALVLLAGTAVCVYLMTTGRSSHGGRVDQPDRTATTTRVVRRDLPETIYVVGTVEPSKAVVVRSRVDGIILRALFHEGDTVEQNTPLFEIDPTMYRSQVDRAEALLVKDQATLQRARSDLARGTNLAGQHLLPRQSLDQLEATTEELKASVKADRATLAEAQAQLGWTVIRAPITGRLGRRAVDAGNLVHATDNTALVDMVQMRPINIIFAVPQERLPDLQARLTEGNLPIDVRSQDGQALLAHAQSALLYNTVDPRTGSIDLRTIVDNNQGKLWPGEAVNVRLILAVHRNILSVPEQAVFEALSGSAVYVVDSTNHVALRSITIQVKADGWVGISTGVRDNERVIVQDQERFAPGREVVPYDARS
jgi:membrane fusion protein, multidrug efflux system